MNKVHLETFNVFLFYFSVTGEITDFDCRRVQSSRLHIVQPVVTLLRLSETAVPDAGAFRELRSSKVDSVDDTAASVEKQTIELLSKRGMATQAPHLLWKVFFH